MDSITKSEVFVVVSTDIVGDACVEYELTERRAMGVAADRFEATGKPVDVFRILNVTAHGRVDGKPTAEIRRSGMAFVATVNAARPPREKSAAPAAAAAPAAPAAKKPASK